MLFVSFRIRPSRFRIPYPRPMPVLRRTMAALPFQLRSDTMRLLSICAMVIALSSSSSAIAACINDAFRFGLNAIADRSQVFNCLFANRALISALCRALVTPGIFASQIAVKKWPRTSEELP
jgi:hypothetical protein